MPPLLRNASSLKLVEHGRRMPALIGAGGSEKDMIDSKPIVPLLARFGDLAVKNGAAEGGHIQNQHLGHFPRGLQSRPF